MTATCPFCRTDWPEHDRPVLANDSCFFLMTPDPILPQSGMIIPVRHVATPFDLNATEWADTFELLLRAQAHFAPARPDGFNVGWNVGVVGGQTVAHAHLHVIARFADEPLAGQGIRHHLKQPGNRRPEKASG